MRKLLAILLCILAAGVLLFWIFARATDKPVAAPTGATPSLPISGNTTPTLTPTSPNTGMMSVNGANGSSITVKDFLIDQTTAKDPHNAGYYTLGYHPDTTTAPPYTITYIAATQYFNIALLQEPIGPTRAAMEAFLMADLGLTRAQMCALNYMVSVPYSVNTSFTGRSLGFSLCPGATALPN